MSLLFRGFRRLNWLSCETHTSLICTGEELASSCEYDSIYYSFIYSVYLQQKGIEEHEALLSSIFFEVYLHRHIM
jgi:hypothetical protein